MVYDFIEDKRIESVCFMKRIATCCFTGHRSEKMNVSAEIVIERLQDAIDDAFSDGYTNYITGMFRGLDIWAAEAVLELKKEVSHIKLICAVPYAGFENNWEKEWQERYCRILMSADEVYYISDRYTSRVYQKRNEWMIDHASMVIAGYTGVAGGTRNTIEYAKKQKDYTVRFLNLKKYCL